MIEDDIYEFIDVKACVARRRIPGDLPGGSQAAIEEARQWLAGCKMKDRFLLADGSPDMPALKEWAEEYYQTLMGMVNGFYAQADIQDVIESLRNIPSNSWCLRN